MEDGIENGIWEKAGMCLFSLSKKSWEVSEGPQAF